MGEMSLSTASYLARNYTTTFNNISTTAQKQLNLSEFAKTFLNLNLVFYVCMICLVVAPFLNGLSILVALNSKMRKSPLSVLITALGITDTAFVLCFSFNNLYFRQLLGVDIRSLSNIGCKIYFWIFKTTKMVSSWFIVYIAVERFIAVWMPLKARVICRKKSVNFAIAITAVVIGGYNGVWHFASTLVNGVCVPNFPEPGKESIAGIFLEVGIAIYSGIPIGLLVVLNPLIIFKVRQGARIRRGLGRSKFSGARSSCHIKTKGKQKTRTGFSSVRRVSGNIMGVTIGYIILVTPISVAHVYSFLTKKNLFEIQNSVPWMMFREIAQILEILNYTLNFLFYTACSSQFRDYLVEALGLNKDTTNSNIRLRVSDNSTGSKGRSCSGSDLKSRSTSFLDVTKY